MKGTVMVTRLIQIVLLIAALLAVTSLPGEARRHWRGGIWIGGPMWGAPYLYHYPYSYPYPYYYNMPPPVIIQQQPETYIQRSPSTTPELGYWYYCPSPPGYYPAIKKCPNGWMRVVPMEPDEEENESEQPDLQPNQ